MKRLAKHTPHIRKGAQVVGVTCLALALLIVGSLSMYLPTRSSQDYATVWGDEDNPDRIDIAVWITKVDTASKTISVTTTDIKPRGALADENGYFRDNATLYSWTALQNTSFAIKSSDFSPVVEHRFALAGIPADYPFDHYSASLVFQVMGGPTDSELPVVVTLWSSDPFFAMTPSLDASQADGIDLELSLRRSTPTLVYATFVMVLMLGLAIAAATAAYYALKQRKGLLFPACSMMAGMLFALIPLRNAVPGSPPIGSVIDFGSFFIAAITIAVSLITCVAVGYRIQLGKDRDDDEVDRLKTAAFAKYMADSGDDWRKI